jgi:DnaD/phage-associated family protein
LSRPDGWEVSITDLTNRATDKEASVRSGLKELRKAGHMKYEVSRDKGRITGWLIRVYEVPFMDEFSGAEDGFFAEIEENQPDGDFQQVEKPQVEFQQVENQRQVLSTLSNTELSNIDIVERTKLLKSLYVQNIGAIVPIMFDLIRNAAIDYPDATWYAPAFEIAIKGNGRNWNYVSKVLQNWKEKGRGWSPIADTKTKYTPQPNKRAAVIDGVGVELQKIINGEL